MIKIQNRIYIFILVLLFTTALFPQPAYSKLNPKLQARFIQLENKQSSNLEFFIDKDSLSQNLDEGDAGLKIFFDASKLLKEKTYPQNIKLEISTMVGDKKSLISLVNKTVKNAISAQNIYIPVTLPRLENSSELIFDVYDSQNILDSSFTEMINISSSQSLNPQESIPNFDCSDSDGECLIEYLLKNITFSANYDTSLKTELYKNDKGRYYLNIPIKKGKKLGNKVNDINIASSKNKSKTTNSSEEYSYLANNTEMAYSSWNDIRDAIEMSFINSSKGFYFNQDGSLQLSTSKKTGFLNIAAGTASKAPISLNAGQLLDSPVEGSIEYDGEHLYFTNAHSRKIIGEIGPMGPAGAQGPVGPQGPAGAAAGSSVNGTDLSNGGILNGSIQFTNLSLLENAVFNGTLQFKTAPQNGYVLTSDANGIARWQAIVTASSEWTDTGTIVHPAETTDDVAIGGSTSSAPIFFDASNGSGSFKAQAATNVPLKVFANAAQTANISEWYNTSATVSTAIKQYYGLFNYSGGTISSALGTSGGGTGFFGGNTTYGLALIDAQASGWAPDLRSISANLDSSPTLIFAAEGGSPQWGPYATDTLKINKQRIVRSARNADYIASPLYLTGQHAFSTAVTNITGGSIIINAGNGASASAAAANGGDLYLNPGKGFGTGRNGNLLLASSRGNVGIGILNPNAALEVNGAIFSTGFKMSTGASNGYVLTSDANGLASWQAAATGTSASGANGSIQFANSGAFSSDNTNLFWDAANKRLGIGTTSPGGFTDTSLSIRQNSATHNTNTIAYLASFNRINSDVASWYLGADTSSNAVLVANNADLRIGKDFGGTFTEFIRVKTNGNVGINNTNPNAKLAISIDLATEQGLILKAAASQTANLTEWQDSAGTILSFISAKARTSFLSSDWTGGSTTAVHQWKSSDGTTQVWINEFGQVTSRGLGASGGFIAQLNDGTTWLSMNTNGGNGYISVGNSSGTERVRLAGGTTSSYFIANSASTMPLYIKAAASQTANLQEWQNSAGTALSAIDNGGRLGLGTSSPARRLHITQAMRIQPQSSPPPAASLGDLYVDSDSNELCFYNGSAWMPAVGVGACS